MKIEMAVDPASEAFKVGDPVYMDANGRACKSAQAAGWSEDDLLGWRRASEHTSYQIHRSTDAEHATVVAKVNEEFQIEHGRNTVIYAAMHFQYDGLSSETCLKIACTNLAKQVAILQKQLADRMVREPMVLSGSTEEIWRQIKARAKLSTEPIFPDGLPDGDVPLYVQGDK